MRVECYIYMNRLHILYGLRIYFKATINEQTHLVKQQQNLKKHKNEIKL